MLYFSFYFAFFKNQFDTYIIKKIYNKIKKKHELILVEGAGGLLTPITKTLVIADLIKSLRLPAIVITRSSLGTINHTLLTLRVAEASNIDILGIIINHLGPKMGLAEKTCQIYLQKFTHIPILGIFPFVQEIKRKNTKYLADLVERYINIELLLEHLILKN
ncbi:MAG: dethiobiotin synthase [Nitrososphaerota archaeon]